MTDERSSHTLPRHAEGHGDVGRASAFYVASRKDLKHAFDSTGIDGGACLGVGHVTSPKSTKPTSAAVVSRRHRFA